MAEGRTPIPAEWWNNRDFTTGMFVRAGKGEGYWLLTALAQRRVKWGTFWATGSNASIECQVCGERSRILDTIEGFREWLRTHAQEHLRGFGEEKAAAFEVFVMMKYDGGRIHMPTNAAVECFNEMFGQE